jgi:hypothetical protein
VVHEGVLLGAYFLLKTPLVWLVGRKGRSAVFAGLVFD